MISESVGFAASGTIRISPPIIVASVVNEKFLRSTTVRHCERSEAISSTTHRPGSEIAASPCGLLAMTGSYLSRQTSEPGHWLNAPKGAGCQSSSSTSHASRPSLARNPHRRTNKLPLSTANET